MSRFTLKCDNQGIINTLEFEEEYLPLVIEQVESFLRGCGYYVEFGALQIMETEEITSTPDYFIKGDTCQTE